MRQVSNVFFFAVILLVASQPASAQFLTADTLKAVTPGLVYKEFSRIIPTSNDLWRVTDPDATFVGDPDNSPSTFLPNPVLDLTVSDLQGAIKAVAIIDVWGGHVGTVDKQFRLNQNNWIDVPPISNNPGNPECYTQQYSIEVEIPIADLVEGNNELEGTSGGQTCYNFNWGQWGWYGIVIRVIYDPAQKTAPTGSITSPAAGATIGEDPVFVADANSAAGIDKVEFVGYYDDFDFDGDGVFLDWQQSYHRLRNDNAMMIRNHMGTAEFSPFEITWDNSWVPDQLAGQMEVVARIRDNNGLWFVTDRVSGLTVSRPGTNVKMYKPTDIPQSYWVRAGQTKSSEFVIPGGDDLTLIESARLHVATWNGISGQAEPGEDHWTKVNGWTTPEFGEDHRYAFDRVDIPGNVLQNGTNTVTFFSATSHHGNEILWPGPGLIARYVDYSSFPASVITHPSDTFTVEGSTAVFSVVAVGADPVTFQWQRNGVDIPGAAESTYTTPQVLGSNDGDLYRCVVSNGLGSDISDEAVLTVLIPGPRNTAGQIVLYDFEEGAGNVVSDVSGVGTPADLVIANPGAVNWLTGALSIDSSTVIATAGAPTKLYDAVMASNEITIEAWMKPANLTQNGPARIVTLSTDTGMRNFTLGQGVSGAASDVCEVRLRSTTTDLNGNPALSTPGGDLTTELTHVVFTRDNLGLTSIYVDGVARSSGQTAGDFSNWNETFRLGLANELTGDRAWLGELELVALFDRALSSADILQNYAAGPQGEPVPAPPVITSTPVATGTIGQAYSYDVDASGTPAPTFALTTGPAGMTIDPASGVIAWTPDALGDHPVVVTATNSEGTDSQSYTLNIQVAPNVLPTAAVTSPTPGAVYQLGDPVPLAATAADTDGSVTQVEFLVDGAVVATVLAAPWEFTWTGGTAGAHSVVARATDDAGDTGDSPAVAFSVNDPSGPSRVTAGLVSLYDFAGGTGNTVPDVSGVGTPLDLQINDPGAVTWLPGGGLSLDTATIVRTAGPATKVIDSAQANNAMTVEAWVTPASVAQTGPARVVTCSTDPSNRNFTLGQGVYNAGDDRWVMRFRTTSTDNNGTPQTATGVGTLTTNLTHVVYTRDAVGAVTIYLDGVPVQSGSTGGTCTNWNPNYALALGNELTEDRPWLGAYFLVAVYDRSLTPGDVQQNFDAGPQGQPAPTAPLITSAPVTTGTFGQAYSYDVDASGTPVPTFALTTGPAGMTIDPASGVIAWTPDALGDHPVVVTATNSEGTDSQSYTLNIQVAPNVLPTAAVTSPTPGAVYQLGDPVPLAATAADTDGSVTQVEFLVDGAVVATVLAAPWEFTWTGGTAGAHSVVARATDDAGDTGDSPAVAFSVNDPSGPSRVTAGLVSLYDFAGGTGNTVPDVSGVGTPLDLQINDPGAVTWLPGGGLSLDTATIVRTAGPATKVIDSAQANNAMTVEAWVTPASVAQTGPARVVTCSTDPSNRNFTLGQGVYNAGDDRWVMRFRTTSTDNNGTPQTATGVGTLTTNLTHVVYTRDAVGAVTIYLDGVPVQSGSTGGTCTNWNPNYALALGNELTEDRPWLGAYFLVAVYDRSLTPGDVQQNFDAGPQDQPAPTAPLITSAPVTTGTFGQAYSYDVDASGTPAPTFALTTGPAGMTIDPASGVIAWTPDALGDHPVVVTATNSEGTDSQSYTLTVQTVPVITTVPDTIASFGQLYQYDVDATGIPAPVYALVLAPNGMIIDPATGVISWTPDVPGDQAIAVTATNVAGSDSQTFTLAVVSAPAITSTPVTAGTIGQPYTYDVEATGDPAPVFALAMAPAGMTIDPASGVIAWTPDALGDHPVEVTATNSEGSDNQAYTLTVQAAPNVSPTAVVTSPIADQVFQLGDPVPLAATAADTDGSVTQVEFLVDGAVVATVLAAPWEFTWTGGTAGAHSVVARATDNAGDTGDSPAVAFSINDPSGPNRVTAGLVTLYDFAGGTGNTVPDVSGVGSPLDLQINDPGAVTWLPGGGLSLNTATIVRTVGPAIKVNDAAIVNNAITVEAWLTPASAAQNGPARVVTCSADPSNRNFTLGQGVYNAGDDRYEVRLRTTATDNNGVPAASTPVGSLTTDLTHVVYTRDASGTVEIYLDGSLASTGFIGGTSTNWNPNYAFALGNELTENRPWLGTYFLVAVYDRALTPSDVQQNFEAGPQGQPAPSAPLITSAPVTTGTFGQFYQYDADASGNPAPVFGLVQQPTGMTIDPVTGVISWTPDVLGDQTVELSAANSEGTDTQLFTLTIQPAPNVPPTATVTGPTPGEVFLLGDPVPLSASATDTDGSVDQVEFLVDGAVVATLTLPPWTTTWSGGTAGSHQVVARATDNEGVTGDSAPVSFVINDPTGPTRVTAGLMALYDFANGSSNLVPDLSGAGTPLDLQIDDPGAVTWLPGGGLTLDSPTIVRSAGPATKVIDAAVANNAITVEAWVAAASTAQNGPARMVSCSGGPSNRNFTLGQGVYNAGDDRYLMRLRTTSTDNNGVPETATATGTLTTALTHVVYTRDAAGTVAIYLDGGLARSGFTGGTCVNWDPGYPLALGNEVTEDRPWLGTYYLVAVYGRALSASEVGQNFTMGPQGQPTPLAPTVTSSPVTAGTLGQPYVYDVDASGYPLPTFALIQAPAGMTINPATGVINWTPGAPGDVMVEVEATNSEGSDGQIFTVSVYPDNPVQLTIWHGLDQRVGHLGPAQADFNVLGNVSPVAEVASLAYSLNGGLYQDLNLGPDNLRLAVAGDFNADIPLSLLQAGLNTVTIRALGTTGQVSTVDVSVTLETGDYQLPVTIAWSAVTDPQDVGQYVDGHWDFPGDALRIPEHGYDRIFLIGNETWQDYEVLVPITINGVFPGEAGLGLLMRFTGHVVGGHRNWPDAQPKWGYQPFGGIGWLRWTSGPTNDPMMQFYHGDYDAADNFGNPAKLLSDPTTLPFGAEEMTKDFGKATVALGSNYLMRMRCETLPDAPDGDGVTRYSWKIWETGTSEPAPWSWQVIQESQYALRQGGVALLAHHVDATFGDVQVTEIPVALQLAKGSDDDVAPGPRVFELGQNQPNPFNPITEIRFSLPQESRASLKVYNVRGRLVETLADGLLPAGPQAVTWDAGRHPSGVYFYRLEAAGLTETKKMIMVK